MCVPSADQERLKSMTTYVACVQRNHPVSVKIRLILSVRFATKVADSRVMQGVEGRTDIVGSTDAAGGTDAINRVPTLCGAMNREGVVGIDEVGETRKRLAMRLRFTRVSVPTMKEYQHAKSLLA